MITKVNAQEFQAQAMNDPVAVVDFSATWCGPCRMLAPVLEDLSGQLEGKAKFYNVDVDENNALAAGFGISSIPCVIILKNGKPVDRTVGFQPAPAIKSWIEKNL